MRRVIAPLVAAFLIAPALAKLPAPSDEAKAKAAEAAAKTAWTDKVGAYKLCQAMDRVAERYRMDAKAAATAAPAAVETPACADPGAFVSPAAASAAAAAAPQAQAKK